MLRCVRIPQVADAADRGLAHHHRAACCRAHLGGWRPTLRAIHRAAIAALREAAVLYRRRLRVSDSGCE